MLSVLSLGVWLCNTLAYYRQSKLTLLPQVAERLAMSMTIMLTLTAMFASERQNVPRDQCYKTLIVVIYKWW
jgi:hypothetical protein